MRIGGQRGGYMTEGYGENEIGRGMNIISICRVQKRGRDKAKGLGAQIAK
jgi:hypothetical protein